MNDITVMSGEGIPFPLRHIPKPPTRLFCAGRLPPPDAKILCVVGSRSHSSYGEEATQKLIRGLKGYNICIVSGLALGIDSLAHRAALEAGLHTLAFPGSGLNPDVLYPSRNTRLAEEILYAGGALMSELDMNQVSAPWTFPQRNRLMAGISDATVVIEARHKSGSHITTRLALDYNRAVGAVPGSITSPLSELPNQLIRDGAVPITCPEDILEMLGFNRPDTSPLQKELALELNDTEKKVVGFLQIEPHTHEQLIMKTDLSARTVNEIISSLEIRGVIHEKHGKLLLC